MRPHREPAGWRFQRCGHFVRRAAPRRIQRFRCLSCGRHFSTQTFDTTYWLRRPELQRPLLHALVSCSALRQAGRALQASASTLQRQASRLGRHCLLFQGLHGPSGPPCEPLALDGLITFEYSQYWPFDLDVLVGCRSRFLYGVTAAELRRSGRMTPFQKKRRAQLEARHGRPDPRASVHAARDLVAMVAPPGADLTILSDQHRAHPRAFRQLPHRIEHLRSSSRRSRTSRNPLHPVDHLDLLLRHSSADHERETIAFSKRRQGALERAAVFQAWRNFMKGTSERQKDSPTPAQRLGPCRTRLRPEDLLARRLVPSRIALPPPLEDVYWRRVPTRQVPRGTRHDLRFAA